MKQMTLFDDEKELILGLIRYKVAKGDSIRMVNSYLQLYEKISGEKLP